MMERLDKALKKAILEDDYFSMDESYYTVLTKEKNSQGKGVRKGYIWAALGNTVKYKILEAGTYPGVIRLGCLQHCKREFLDIEGDEDAKEIVDRVNYSSIEKL